MKGRMLSAGALALGVVLLFAVNILSGETLRSQQIDLTQHHLYTLSAGTRKILANLNEPVTLRLFLSKSQATALPSLSGYTMRVRELLQEYQRLAHGKLRLQIIDPEPFSEQEDRAVAYGLRGVPLNDQSSNFYFGLVGTSSTDKKEVIPFFSPARSEFLEYDVTRLVYELEHPKQKVIGLLSALPMNGVGPASMAGGGAQPWVVLEQMRKQFDVRELGQDVKTIPPDVDVLMVVRPRDLPLRTLYSVDQFVLRGGRALVFVDPYSESDPNGAAGSPRAGSANSAAAVEKMLGSWGLHLVPSLVAGDLRLAEKVRFNRFGRVATVDYPVWMNVPQAQLDNEDLVTASVGNLVLASPGILQTEKKAHTKVTPLVRTTADAMRIGTGELGFRVDPRELVRKYHPGGKPLMLAARVTGKVKTAFPDGPPPSGKAEEGGKQQSSGNGTADPGNKGTGKKETSEAPLTASGQDVNLIVVADTDLLQDRFWVRVQNFFGSRIAIPNAGNGDFVVNALDNLTGSNALISIRSRGGFTRPLGRIDAIRARADMQFQAKEQQLLDRLKQTEHKLDQLQSGKGKQGGPILSQAQQQELQQFRHEKVRIREELRDVRHRMRRDIESLETRLKLLNIGLVPLLIGIGGVGVGVYRVRRRGRGARAHAGT